MSEFNRIELIVKRNKLKSVNALARELGYAKASIFYNIKTGRNSISKNLADHICERFKDINRTWLLTGEGDAKINETDQALKTQTLIPMYDVEAAGSTDLADVSAVTKPTKMINIGDLLSDSQAAIRMYGNSMLPGYPSGCVIGTRPITGNVIEWGEVYVLETKDARYIKRLYKGENDTIVCYSDSTNTYAEGPRKGKSMYEPFEVAKKEVIRLHRVTGSIKRNDNSFV